MTLFAIDAITGFSMMPLRVASIIGLVMGFVSILLVGYTLGSWLRGSVVDGWTSLTTLFPVISSTQLLVLGVLGEYLGRLICKPSNGRSLCWNRFILRQGCNRPIGRM